MKMKKLSILCTAAFLFFFGSLTANAKNVSDFQDVPSNAWYYPYVKDAAEQNFMTGLTDTVFGPSESLARAQFVTVLYRLTGTPDTAYQYQFPDIADGQFYSAPVTWATNNHLVTGYTDSGMFGPSDPLNREQLATILYRYAQTYLGFNTSQFSSSTIDDFPDAGSIQPYARDAMNWALATGIITGDNGMLNPQGTVNRAVCATMISRFTGIVGNPTEHVHTYTFYPENIKQGYACNTCYNDVTGWKDMYACHGGWHTHEWCLEPSRYVCSCGAKIHTHSWMWHKPQHYTDGTVLTPGYYLCYSCFSFSSDGYSINNDIQKDCDRWKTVYDFTGKSYLLLTQFRSPEDYELDIESITLNRTIACMTKAEQLSLAVSFTPETTTSSRAVTFSSSNPAVAAVDENGTVKALSNGTATITATSSNGCTDTCFIRVMDTNVGTVKSARLLVNGQDVTNGSLTVASGSKYTVSLATDPQSAVYNADYSVDGDSIYMSGSISVGLVSEYSWQNGVSYTNPTSEFTSWKPGSSKLTAEIRDLNGNTFTVSATINVK